MSNSSVILDKNFIIGELDRRIFGTFVEHMGRCVYTGIFEPDHATADERGFRGDVLDLVKELGPTIVRYPGGNFLSGYNWEDGVGPIENRPARLDLAWFTTETNRFGTNEFIRWCKKAEVEPMLGVNLGTRGPDDARRFVEYCNHQGGTTLSSLRKEHGFAEPHAIKFWCLGNEMDGPWQIGGKTAGEYGRIAAETAKVMKWVDPTLTLAACGSSNRFMPTFGAWEREVLQHTFKYVDFISIHLYFENDHNDPKEFLANPDIMDRYIKEVVAVSDSVAGENRSSKRIMLSFDEWNVWYKARTDLDMHKPGWPEAPPLIEEIYDLQDALVVGGALITLINNADRVKAACLAQLVNVIGPIMTEKGGPAWRQTIFHPFSQASKFGHGKVLDPKLTSTTYQTKVADEVNHISVSAIDNQDGNVTLFILNRELEKSTDFDIDLRSFGAIESTEAWQLTGTDLLATNTRENPDHIKPEANSTVTHDNSRATIRLQPASWNLVRLRTVCGR
jgi:alpha-N-arabinofuranosidase